MYHVELRRGSHIVCCLNQSEPQALAILVPWAKGESIERGERRWDPRDAGLTVLEGPELSVGELAMGRGWRNAQRRGHDVTEQVLASVRAQLEHSARGGAGATGATPAGGAPAGEDELLADSLGLELLALLDDGELPPARVWELARMRLEGGSAADSLALAERAVRSLVRRGLVVVRRGAREGTVGDGAGEELAAEEVEAALAAAETWSGGDGPGALSIARKA